MASNLALTNVLNGSYGILLVSFQAYYSPTSHLYDAIIIALFTAD
ncbi:hypothetical protein EJP617_22050 [Erwinia sp. Ejp617]|nr:hypothetical protein EJP617_22050 [Erwinia sp. Ejp617]